MARLKALPIGCARLREKHLPEDATPCSCFETVPGGYPTPLLHTGRFRKSWRDSLRNPRPAAAPASPQRRDERQRSTPPNSMETAPQQKEEQPAAPQNPRPPIPKRHDWA